MSTELTKLVEELNKNLTDERKMNDERYDALEKGNDARAEELKQQLDSVAEEIAANQKKLKEEERKNALMQERLDILEATSTRPGKSVVQKAAEEHKKAFFDAMRGQFKDAERNSISKKAYHKFLEAKTLQVGTDNLGGHGVPEEISRDIEKLMLSFSDILAEIGIKTVGSSDYKEVVSINQLTSAWAAELGTRSQQTDPNLRQVAPTGGELYTYIFASNEILEDAFFNIEDWLVMNAAESAAKALDLSLWSGDGSAKPTGMINTAPTTSADNASPLRAAAAYQYLPTDTVSPQAVNADDLIDLCYALNRGYRGNAKWAMNQNTQAAVRKLKSTNGDYYWQPSFQAGQPDRLLGYPVLTWHDMADPTTADGYYAGFGDFKRAYTLVSRMGLAMTHDDNITTPGTHKFYIRRRYFGIPCNNDAVKFLKLADT